VTMDRPLTVRELRALFARRQKGERTADLAAEVGMSVNNLGKRWRRVGCHAEKVQRVTNNRQTHSSKVYAMRAKGFAWRQVVEAFGMDPDDAANTRLLYMRLVRYCKRVGCPVPSVEPTRRGSGRRR